MRSSKKEVSREVMVAKAARLQSVLEKRKELEKEEKKLKEFFKKEMTSDVDTFGDVRIEIYSACRSGFDKESFVEDYGEDILNTYKTETIYKGVKAEKAIS